MKWHDVKNGLPDRNGKYIVTEVITGFIDLTTVKAMDYDEKGFYVINWHGQRIDIPYVVAWAELPAPYIPDDGEKLWEDEDE